MSSVTIAKGYLSPIRSYTSAGDIFLEMNGTGCNRGLPSDTECCCERIPDVQFSEPSVSSIVSSPGIKCFRVGLEVNIPFSLLDAPSHLEIRQKRRHLFGVSGTAAAIG